MKHVFGVMQVVSKLDAMCAFFTKVLEFEEVERFDVDEIVCRDLFQIPQSKARLAKLRLGNEFHFLLEFPLGHREEYPKESRSNDLWFQHIAIVVSDMEKAHAKLVQHGVQPISHAPQTIPEWNTPAAGIKAFYFRSPEGHPLEIIYFPSGKGSPLWQNKKSLFLGIDHTAIASKNTELSIKFYQRLGMEVVGGSLNYGVTQEKLSGVPGARVKITTLRFPGSESMGVELLEYLDPLDGRSKPKNIKANHPLDTKILFSQVPAPVIGLSTFQKGSMQLDPDGHCILLFDSN